MRMVIDYQKCRGTGQCAYLHPELFVTDEVGAPKEQGAAPCSLEYLGADYLRL